MRPNMMIIDKEKKIWKIMNYAVPADGMVKIKKHRKIKQIYGTCQRADGLTKHGENDCNTNNYRNTTNSFEKQN